ncbi:hypothetical protein C8R45DRAFT_528226 [Mycena sanguinolenta]|nr:hypothetical protein C8R45DRAFT_528226 [Mycena sanguinolenta]
MQPVDYLHLVPGDVWISCWTFCTSRQLRRISLVCRAFRAFSQPLLFQYQSLDLEPLMYGLSPGNWIDGFHRLHRAAVRVDELGASSFAALVRSWSVKFPQFLPTSRLQIKNMNLFVAMRDRVISRFFATLGLFQNISSLHVKTCKIDCAGWETIMCLPLLHTLHLQVSDIDMGHRSISAAGLRESKAALRTPSPRMLHSLRMDDALYLLDEFAASELHHLVHLSIPVIRSISNMELFVQFIEQCPRLESLAIEAPFPVTRVSSIDGPPRFLPLINFINVPGHALPVLHTLTGPSHLIRSLAPNRPIRSVRFVESHLDVHELLSVCTDISRSTIPIHALALPCVMIPESVLSIPALPPTQSVAILGFLHAIISLFPDLRALSLSLPNSMLTPGVNCMLFRRQGYKYEVDERLLVFSDADAFDNLPVEELSDDELTEDVDADVVTEGFSIHPMGSMTSDIQTILACISDDTLDLPHNIESFHLEAPIGEEMPLVKQHQALFTLSERYGRLCEVQVGGRATVWRRRGGENTWHAEGKSGVRIAHH